jgi:hypothetical protein
MSRPAALTEMRAIVAAIIAFTCPTYYCITVTPALAETLTCTDWQGIRTCQDSHGYVSHETQWQGMTIGQDSDGNRWDHEPLARL